MTAIEAINKELERLHNELTAYNYAPDWLVARINVLTDSLIALAIKDS